MVYLLVRGSVLMVVEGTYFPATVSPFILTVTTMTMTVHSKDSYSSSHAALLLLLLVACTLGTHLQGRVW